MVKSKAQSKKPRKGGVDFKKIKRKIGRKLPPPNNATNTEIKSKAIVLPEQSVASEKTGLAVSKKGLTLKELLQQTSHHNAKVRKDALIGIKDIFLKHPAELNAHKLAVIEKLRERIGDDDKLVRETLYQLFKTVIFPGCKEDSQGPLISLLMAYIFNAMTHLAIDVRLMAFKFCDLVLQYFPSSFSIYSEKVLQNYEAILRKNQFFPQEKGKFKSVLGGLVCCLSQLPSNKRRENSSLKNDVSGREMLHSFEPEASRESSGLTNINKTLKDVIPVLISCLHDFMPFTSGLSELDSQSYDCMLCILQSIELIVRFIIYEIQATQQEREHVPSNQNLQMPICDKSISVVLKKLWDLFPIHPAQHLSQKDDDRLFMLNIVSAQIFLQLSDLNYPPPELLEKFMEFIEHSLLIKIPTLSSKVSKEKHLLPFIPYIPKLIAKSSGDWRSRTLQAFTEVFKNCNPESALKLACLSAIKEMLAQGWCWPRLDVTDSVMLHYQINWIRELPSLLNLLGDTNPQSSEAVLRLLLSLGQHASAYSPFLQEFNNMQYTMREFYCRQINYKNESFGPFLRLPQRIQELSLCCLYYFSFVDSSLLESLVSCCLCQDLEPSSLFRVLEVLHSAFKVGHIQISDYISFLVSLLSRFHVYPEFCASMKHDGKSNHKTFRDITSAVCSSLSEIGEGYLVFQMLENIIVHQICVKPPVDNTCAFLRLLVTIDSSPTRLSDQSIINLSNVLSEYVLDVMQNITEKDEKPSGAFGSERSQYYLLSCLFLFCRSKRLLELVLDAMGSQVSECGSLLSSHHAIPKSACLSKLSAIITFLLHLLREAKIQRAIASCKMQIESMLQQLLTLLSSKKAKMTLEERHKIQDVHDKLKAAATKLFGVTPTLPEKE